MKKLRLICLFFVFSVIIVNIIIFILADKGLDDSELPDDISNLQEELPTIKLNTDFYFLGEKMEYSNNLYLATGRIYLPLNQTLNIMNGKIKEDEYKYIISFESKNIYIDKKNDNLYPKKIISIDGENYISLFTLLADSGYKPVFDSLKNRVDIFYAQETKKNIISIVKYKEKNPAYLRLEDIMADGMDADGYYNDIGLEKLRAIADYLYDNKQKFYIAWIPLYKNPLKKIENNLTKDFNLYNASFLYTLDYLLHKGGKIGLHGYSHQYNDEKSADGYEFGKETPYSDYECVERMLLAKKTSRDLGYQVNFFEFPHYGATSNQLRYAEKYFDVIYQQNKTVKNEGTIVIKTGINGKEIKYVPTPADYIMSRYDTDGINSRIDDSIHNNWIVSLFYHPKIDFEVMNANTQNNTRICSLSENSSIFKLIEKIISEKLRFSYF